MHTPNGDPKGDSDAGSAKIESTASIFPFRNLLITSDAARLRGDSAEFVVGPSHSTHLIARFCVRGAGEATLDLGSGGGALTLDAAAYSERVIGSDINARARPFAEFNAALNGIENVEFTCGDAFEPVKGRSYTRIVANPPFFISAARRYTYCDSPLALDGFSRLLTKEAPAFLREGGYFQMLCEWVQLEGQAWDERLQEWTAGSGCDVLVVVGPELSPVAYAEKRLNEAKLLKAPGEIDLFEERLAYLTENKVERILAGVVNMRKRQGQNWFATLKADPVSDSTGEAIRERFETLTYVGSHLGPALLAGKFKLTDDTYLEQHHSLKSGQWEISSSELVKGGGLHDRLRLDAVVSSFIPLFDGMQTLEEIAARVSTAATVPMDTARARCIELARRLLQSSFVVPA
jgi:methylase of polypeptide subunit release factors